MVSGFQKFLLRGNLIDLAVGVLIGAAFGKVVESFTSGLILPIIGIFGGVPDFSALVFTINGSVFKYGAFITALLSFVLSAAVIYFFVIVPFNRLMERFKREEKPPVAEPTNEEKLLAEIRDALRQRPL
ncbi:large conductance mechanosensitive channel protein MscL [Deinococcus psychrotolerans]|uniref:Large-conductance mechanosensitive channel n=1 Tax=Deinococcus psychrotolerans TaxID=2489213 RepID=A0A3G8YDX7_9DEIO|nr:large conductance mechanosensitive channel protein MscL [Deinococcus psychrotolerans]AZI42427.1 large conductance mechanosensitive channel protein MscL [Deinococcus psychrotolerans]